MDQDKELVEQFKSAVEEPFVWAYSGYRKEWYCPHGVGHSNRIHGCDGCCTRHDFPGNQ